MVGEYYPVPPIFTMKTSEIGGGLRPRRYIDHRNYSLPGTFGSVLTFLTELNLDAGLTNPSQNEPDQRFGNPAYPNGCTGFTTTDIATDQDKIVYDPGFTYKKTLLIADLPDNSGCSVQDSMKSSTVYGLRAQGESDDAALFHRRGPYFETRPTDGLDWFDSMRSAMQLKRNSLSVGVPWCVEFTYAQGGIVNQIPIDLPQRAKKNFNGHDVKACGWESINGRLYIRLKVWLGPNWGDHGFYWFSRDAINDLMAIKGTVVFSNAHALPGEIRQVEISILETIVSYLLRMVGVKP